MYQVTLSLLYGGNAGASMIGGLQEVFVYCLDLDQGHLPTGGLSGVLSPDSFVRGLTKFRRHTRKEPLPNAITGIATPKMRHIFWSGGINKHTYCLKIEVGHVSVSHSGYWAALLTLWGNPPWFESRCRRSFAPKSLLLHRAPCHLRAPTKSALQFSYPVLQATFNQI